MKLPELDQPEKYVGLYIVDFGDQVAIGYTAEEVALLLESQRYADVKVYKIYRARPDGSMELRGVPNQRFHQESGMFFACLDENTARTDYHRLADWAAQQPPPCRAKWLLARQADGTLLLALVYPAEYEQEISQWMLDSGFRGRGPVDAGISQVTRFYQQPHTVLESLQLWPAESLSDRDREQLFASVGKTLQR